MLSGRACAVNLPLLCTMSINESRNHSKQPPAEEHTADQDRVRTDPLPVEEVGGRGTELDPVRYGDWEKNGRCIDF